MDIPVSKIKFLDPTMIDEQIVSKKEFFVFIFVNSKSGSWNGRQLLEKYHPRHSSKHISGQVTNFYVCDLYNRQELSLFFVQINKLSLAGENVKIVMSGGDGTVQWVLSQAIQNKVDFEKIVFGVLPIGTGNDFAKSIGWDQFKFKISDKKMQQLGLLLIQSQTKYYDIWQCIIKVNDSGKIIEIKNGIESQSASKCLVKSFTNYFGIGSDAKITFIAQKINAKSVFAKKLSYTLAWFCSLISPTEKFKKVLKSFVKNQASSAKILRQQKQYELKHNLRTTQADDNQQSLQLEIQIDQNDSCITFLNSTVSMELKNIWKTPYCAGKEKYFEDQKIDDGKIEIVSYRNSASIGLERALHMAKKVQQGTGPFIINFIQNESQNIQTFIHINGQPYKITKIDSIQIRKNNEVPESRLKVVIFQN